jgi:hypothetical protein
MKTCNDNMIIVNVKFKSLVYLNFIIFYSFCSINKKLNCFFTYHCSYLCFFLFLFSNIICSIMVILAPSPKVIYLDKHSQSNG